MVKTILELMLDRERTIGQVDMLYKQLQITSKKLKSIERRMKKHGFM